MKCLCSMEERGDEWRTPPELFKFYDDADHFVFDAAATADNHLTPLWTNNALKRDWIGPWWLNPPYSRDLIGDFVDKAIEQAKEGRHGVILVRHDHSTAWFRKLWHHSEWVNLLTPRIRFLCERGRPHTVDRHCHTAMKVTGVLQLPIVSIVRWKEGK